MNICRFSTIVWKSRFFTWCEGILRIYMHRTAAAIASSQGHAEGIIFGWQADVSALACRRLRGGVRRS